jgi:hypothetical protein
MDKARVQAEKEEMEACWAHLERAHILSQPFAWLHVVTHFEMLKVAFETRDGKEIRGQALRLVVAAPGSLLRKYPEGNTGRSHVSMFQPMPSPKDLFEPVPDDNHESKT